MKLSVSNLSFAESDSIHSILNLLKTHNISGLEIAPSRLFSQIGSNNANRLADFRKYLQEHDLKVSGIQSLLFGRPELQLFEKSTWPALHELLSMNIQLASYLGASIIVFGSPKNRIKSNLTTSDAYKLAAEFFYRISDELEANQVVLSIEPNAREYGADWVTTYEEAVDFVSISSSPWIQPQIDTGSMHMSGEDFIGAFKSFMPCHIHVSEPNLHLPPLAVDHEGFSAAISASEYRGWIALETLYQTGVSLESASRTLNWFQLQYQGGIVYG